MGSAAPGLISERGSARRAGQHLAVSAWVRFSVRPRASSVRGFVRSSVRPVGPPSSTVARSRRPATSPPSSPTTTATRAARGFTVLRACRPRPPVRRRSGPHRLHSDGLRPRAWSTPTATSSARNGNRYEPPVAGPPLSAARRRSRDRRLRARRSGRGSQDRALPPHSSLPDGPACGRTPPVVKTRAGLKKLGDGH